MTLTYKIAPWCGLIRVIVNWIIAKVTRLLSQPEPQSDIMVAILFSGSSPGPAAAYILNDSVTSMNYKALLLGTIDLS